MIQQRVHSRVIASGLLLILAVFLAACLDDHGPGGGQLPAPSPTGWYAVAFTQPITGEAGKFRGGPDEFLAEAIRGARISVDMAIYHFNLWSLRDALLDAHRRGVAVRLVAESDNLDEPEIVALKDAGINVLGDRRESLMHHKFAVIDRLEVWTGSMNFTVNGAYFNDNNLVRLRSSRLAENYTQEFEEMFVDDLFGQAKLANTPHPELTVEGTPLEIYFSPSDGTAARIVELISGARESIEFLAYSFTSDAIASAMIERAQVGVTVSGVFEESQYFSNIGSQYDSLHQAGLGVRLDGNPRNMHHKVIILDHSIVITGSYNFSNSAERFNDENTLVLHDPQIAALYAAEFTRIFSLAKE